MLNPFPHLLTYTFFAPTLLRVVAACMFFYIAYALIQKRNTVIEMAVPIIGKPSEWMCWLSALITALTGAALLFGYGTQWAAIVGMIIALAYGVAPHRYHAIVLFPRTTFLLLFIICLSLLFTGAGAMAFDVPL
jgi:uncharacterized membrane protein YphA (DoxX/SURF4 family)